MSLRVGPEELAAKVLEGDRRAIARANTLVESRDAVARDLLAAVYPHTGRADVIGITGPPGSGKSTLTDQLVSAYRAQGKKVGVVAVDPSSPFTGGALLGDRVRLSPRVQTDPGVFFRSMATRGHLGGLSRATADATRILDAAGNDVVLIETVGVGQAEIDVMRLADSVLVVAVPGLGDEIQNIKAGLMEIGDIFVVNKADREGADRTVAELQAWLEHGSESAWDKPVVRTVAAEGKGIDELTQTLQAHHDHLEREHRLHAKRRIQAEHEVLEVLRERVVRHALTPPRRDAFDHLVGEVAERRMDPYQAAAEILPEDVVPPE